MSCAAARSGCISCTCPYRGREHKTTACRYRRGDRFPPCRLSGAWPIGAPRVAVHVPGATPQPRAPRIRRARVHPTRAAYTPASAARVGLIGYPVSGCPWLIGVFLYVGIVYLSTCLPRCARRVFGVYLWLSTVYHGGSAPTPRHGLTTGIAVFSPPWCFSTRRRLTTTLLVYRRARPTVWPVRRESLSGALAVPVPGDGVAPLSPRRAVCGGHGCTPACRLPVLCYTVTYTAAWGREQVPCIRRPTCRATTVIMAA